MKSLYPYTAWIWRTPNKRLQSKFRSEETARTWLTSRLCEWPHAFEYGIDLTDDNGEPVAIFLSDSIKERIAESK